MTEPIVVAGAPLRDAVAAIERTRRLIAVVVDDRNRLLGVISDGDVRRALLAGKGLDSPAAEAMTREPIVAPASTRPDEVFDLMQARGVAAVPVVEADGRFVRVVQIHDFAESGPPGGAEGFAAAVVMAGGEGRRLRPLTVDRPKPMIDIGGVPLIERQVRTMIRGGLRRIYISTNYLAHVIEEHFGDGSSFGAEIRYLREHKKLGTAGALSLLPERPAGPLLVINGDVLTTSDFGKLLAFHIETGAFVTVGAVIYRVEIPFGVLRVSGVRAVGLEEKPSQSFLCNAGMYVLAPGALDLVPPDSAINMTDVIEAAIAAGRHISVFPIHEYWSDIGNPSDLQRAMAEFEAVER
ncbi:MAG: CBS domain-containing protein [Bacteroidales bacterium]|nr:CBS domain-containing protein [Bacteroidales bacterium]